MGLPPRIVAKSNRQKNEANQISNQRHRFCYFDNQESKYGSAWLNQKDPKSFKKDCRIILRDLIKENIDLEKHSHYFNELVVREFLINICKENIDKYTIRVREATHFMDSLRYYNYIVPDQVLELYSEDKLVLTIYEKMYTTFTRIEQTRSAKEELEALYSFLNGYNGKYFTDIDPIMNEFQSEFNERWNNLNES